MINDYEATTPITTDARIPENTGLSNDDVISELNKLIEVCKDGQEGFKIAAEGVERSDLKSFFYEYSQQRAQFAGELQTLVQGLGGDPDNSGSFSGTLHRGWMNLKSALMGNEDSAKSAYKSAAQEPLPGYIHDVVTDQLRAILQAHDRVKALRDAAANAKSSTVSTSR
jgi:uncharacterized protein (TIGR02284 family)